MLFADIVVVRFQYSFMLCDEDNDSIRNSCQVSPNFIEHPVQPSFVVTWATVVCLDNDVAWAGQSDAGRLLRSE